MLAVAQPSPGALAVIDFLNSRPHSKRPQRELLHTPETAAPLLRRFGQPEGVPPTLEALAELRSLRGALIGVVVSPDSGHEWDELTDHASAVSFRQVFSAPGEVRPRQVSGNPVVGAVLLAVTELVATDTWSRIRICANKRCGHAFYDTTRSRTQRWHAYEPCGNRTNVASYRARRSNAR